MASKEKSQDWLVPDFPTPEVHEGRTLEHRAILLGATPLKVRRIIHTQC